jgi:predicted outer membrane repeat protein
VVLASSSLTLDSCYIVGNSAGTQGGGMRINGCRPTITATTIADNSAAQGGGVYETSLNAVFNDCDISSNTATKVGGGVMFKSSSPTLERCTISGNSAPEGAGMRLYGSNAVINHTAIVDNSAGSGAQSGGGISCVYSSSPVLTNCTFNGNSALKGGAILCYYNSTVTLLNGILWGDAPQEIYIKRHATYPSTVSVDYSDVRGGEVEEVGVFVGLGGTLNWGDGNLDSDPLFVDAITGDYHLQDGSPCIDTGDPASPDDPDGTTADMGAYYFDQTARAPRLETPEDQASLILPNAVSLNAAYPNPFNAVATLPYALPQATPVKLVVFDISGRRVATLLDGIQSAGYHKVIWDASRIPSGVYIARMDAAGVVQNARLVLQK